MEDSSRTPARPQTARERAIQAAEGVLLRGWQRFTEDMVQDSPEGFCHQYATMLADAHLLVTVHCVRPEWHRGHCSPIPVRTDELTEMEFRHRCTIFIDMKLDDVWRPGSASDCECRAEGDADEARLVTPWMKVDHD